MKKIELHTESFEFEHNHEVFRAIPFYELSIQEWIIYQNGKPKYYLNLDDNDSNFSKQLRRRLEEGIDLETIIYKLGIFLGLDWTTRHNIQGIEIQNSFKPEKTIVSRIGEFSEIAHDLLFISTESIDLKLIQNEDALIESKFKNGQVNLESCVMDVEVNISKLLSFIFPNSNESLTIYSDGQTQIINLNPKKNFVIDELELKEQYDQWIIDSDRNNTMDEYGSLLGIISYVERNQAENNLLLKIDKRQTVPNML